MKRKTWCPQHRAWHTAHASAHCKIGRCPRELKGRECPVAPGWQPNEHPNPDRRRGQ